MKNMTDIARPYARAAFEVALAKNDLDAWQAMLNSAADMMDDKRLTPLLAGSLLSKKQLLELFEVIAPLLNQERKNFIALLIENKRVLSLSDIAALFAIYRAQSEKTINVQVVSSKPLDNTYQDKLIKALTKRLQHKVVLQCEIDPTILGGVVVRAGDTVIDGSVRGKLNRLMSFI